MARQVCLFVFTAALLVQAQCHLANVTPAHDCNRFGGVGCTGISALSTEIEDEEQALIQLAKPTASRRVADSALRGKSRAGPSLPVLAEPMSLASAASVVVEALAEEDTIGRVEHCVAGGVFGVIVLLCIVGAVRACLPQKGGKKAAGPSYCDVSKPIFHEDSPLDPEVQITFPSGPAAILLAAVPMPRLAHVGTTYAVPVSSIQKCEDSSFHVDLPMTPAVWPLRAHFERAAGQNTWSRIELTVDINATGLPPLLYCTPCGPDAPLPRLPDSGTGATRDLNRAEKLAVEAGGSAWVEVCGGSGALFAVISKSPEGKLSVLRPGYATLEIEAHLDLEDYWIVVRKRGQDIALTSRLLQDLPAKETADGLGAELRAKLKKRLDRIHAVDHEEKFADLEEPRPSADLQRVQMDTLPDTSSPESVLLLMCMLATLVFSH